MHAILALVSGGMGVSLVPRSAGSLLARGVVLRELRPEPQPLAELHLIWRRGHDNPALRVFRDRVIPKLF